MCSYILVWLVLFDLFCSSFNFPHSVILLGFRLSLSPFFPPLWLAEENRNQFDMIAMDHNFFFLFCSVSCFVAFFGAQVFWCVCFEYFVCRLLGFDYLWAGPVGHTHGSLELARQLANTNASPTEKRLFVFKWKITKKSQKKSRNERRAAFGSLDLVLLLLF